MIQQPGTDIGLAADLLKNIDSDRGQRRLSALVSHHSPQIPRLLASCANLTFFYIGWDDEQLTLIQKAGPNRRRVSSLLRQPGIRRSRRQQGSGDECDAVWDFVEAITDEIERQRRFRFVLLWRLDDHRLAEMSHSGVFTRQAAWRAIRDSVPESFRGRVPTDPPPDQLELQKSLIEPAPQTEHLPNPKHLAGVRWHVFQKGNFARDPAWRWNRAWSLVLHGCNISRKRDDRETGRAVRFLRGLRRQRDTLAPYSAMPNFMAAHQLWKNGGDQQLEVEARILAGQTNVEIAERMRMEPEVIGAFADTFFDVRPRLNAKTYVLKKVIGTQWATGLNPYDGLLKLLAYRGGAAMLETVLPYFRNNGQRLAELTRDETVQDPIATSLDLLLRAHAMPGDSKTALRMASIFEELMRDMTPGSDESIVGLVSKLVPPLPDGGEFSTRTEKAIQDADIDAA